MATWSKETRVKLLGGELIYRESGTSMEQYRTKVDGIKKKMQDLKPAFDAFKPDWQTQTREVFDAEGLPDSWPALSPAYEATKQGPSMLRETDRLYNSLVGDSPDSIWETTQTTIKYGSNVPYFPYHQVGTDKMPARPPLVMLPATWEKLMGRVSTYIMGGLGTNAPTTQTTPTADDLGEPPADEGFEE